jgi:hypothetical protein
LRQPDEAGRIVSGFAERRKAKQITEITEMHSYQTLAATNLVSRIIDRLEGSERFLHPAATADWMETHGIAIEDVLVADRETLQAQVAALLDRDMRYRIRLAA